MKKVFILFLFLILLPWSPVGAEGGELIKGESSSAVYYWSVDGKRYVFPNAKIYNSWYEDFSQVRTISDEELAEISLGGNVFYKPNSRLVKITTDPKVYWVDKNGVLRHVVSEGVAQSLFGNNWLEQIDDLPDVFFTGYSVGDSIDFNHYITIDSSWTIDQNKQYSHENSNSEQEQEQEEAEQEEVIVDEAEQPDSINLTVYSVDQVVYFKWMVDGGNTEYGYMLVKSTNEDVSYPEDEYVKIDSAATSYIWNNLSNGDESYYAICRLNSDGSCGKYSDVESQAVGATDKVPSLILSGVVEDGMVKLSWEKEWVSANYGFYLMRGIEENPEFYSSVKFGLSNYEESYNWVGLNSGTHHFRLCRYNGTTDNRCKYYSNDLELMVP